MNIFFRMDSTGVEGRIQVNERTRDVLKQASCFLKNTPWSAQGAVHIHIMASLCGYVCKRKFMTIDCCYDMIATLNPDVSGQTVYFLLFQWFEFEERGDIFVKGKDNMKVFLFTKQKESALRMFWAGRIIISELSQRERRCPKNGAPQMFLEIVFLTNKAVLSPYCECEGQKDAIHEIWKGFFCYYVIKQKKEFP